MYKLQWLLNLLLLIKLLEQSTQSFAASTDPNKPQVKLIWRSSLRILTTLT